MVANRHRSRARDDGPGSRRVPSDREADVQDVAVLHQVLLALHAQLAVVSRLGLAAAGDEIRVMHHLGADEAALEVGVDAAGGARSAAAAADGPGLHLVLADREEADPVEQLVGGADEAGAARRGEAHRLQEVGLLGGIELRDLRLDRGTERDRLGPPLARRRLHLRGRGARRRLLGRVPHHQQRPPGEEPEMGHLLLLGIAPAHRAQRLAGIELPVQPLQLVELGAGLAVLLAQPIEPLLHDAEVVQQELGVEVAELPRRARRRSVERRKSANDEAEGVHFRQRPQRFGRQPGTLGGRPRHVDEEHLRPAGLAGLEDGRERIHARVGHLDRAQVHLPARCSPTLVQPGERVEPRGLARLRVSDEACLHGASPRRGRQPRGDATTRGGSPVGPACPPDICATARVTSAHPRAFFRLRIARRYDQAVQSMVGPRAREIAIDAAVAALVVGLFLGLLVASDRVATGSNPDQWFHFAISRMSQQGLVRTLPQAEDLGWGVGFPEKEFLFHRLTALAYGMGGENAVVLACRAVSVASLVLLYWLARRTAGRVVAGASVAGLVVANPYLLFRLGMVRPHVLAIFLLLAIAAALLLRSRFLGFAAGATFALAYHAVYLPAVLALAFGIVALYRRATPGEPDDGAFAASALVLAGLACGVVANPYFPANVTMGLEHLGFAFSASASLPGVHVGAEVLPMAPGKYLRFFGVALLAAIASAVWLRRDAAGGEQPWNRAVLTVAALFLVGAGPRAVRATEYGLPLLSRAVAAALRGARRRARTRATA